jgi:hypothetical protein
MEKLPTTETPMFSRLLAQRIAELFTAKNVRRSGGEQVHFLTAWQIITKKNPRRITLPTMLPAASIDEFRPED